MDFGTQDCDFDQYLSCYTFFKSESPLVSVDSCSQHLVQCPLHKSSNGIQVLPGQYHHQDHQNPHHSVHPFPSIIQPIPSLLASPIIPTSVEQSFSSKFACTLVAQTLPAVKLTEEPVTCLNQGQSYDIKLKKHGDTNPAKYYKSNIRLMFHHRRLQHSEQEQFQHWLKTRPDQRLIELDLPLAYNVLSSAEDPRTPNMISISWMGQSEASISVKINCISTEFTAKKHGGEKGVPFRLQVDTYAVMDDEELNTHLLHRAFCLVKVFKPNGADRKNKNDSLKLSKVPSAERDMYHPAYEVTTFSEVQPQSSTFSPTEWINDEGLLRQDSKKPSSSSHQTPNYSVQNKAIGSPGSSFSPEQQNTPQENDKTWTDLWKTETRQPSVQPILTRSSSSLFTDSSPSPPSLRSTIFQDANNNFVTLRNQDKMASPHLNSESTTSDLRNWLKVNNFEKWIPAFEHYSGAEIYMLSKEDFMKICGVAEGIRMFYKIYSGIGPSTKKSLYISHMAGTKRRLYMRKNLSSESLESPSSVSSTVTTGSCSNLLANNINDMTLEHQNQVKSHTLLNQTDSNNCVKKGSKRSHEGSETSRGHQENNNSNNVDNNIPNCKKNKFSDDRDVELPVYSAIHLKWLTHAHLVEKLCETFHLSNQLVAQIYLVDRDGTDITVTDEIVERLKDHSIFTMDVLTDGASRKKFILLIPLCQKD